MENNTKVQPLPAGNDPTFLNWRVYADTDYDKYNFGKLLSEEECESSQGL